jgi:hypothetical protein
MDQVADLELGLSQEFGVALGGEESGHPVQLGLEDRAQDEEEVFGFGILFGAEDGSVHEIPP